MADAARVVSLIDALETPCGECAGKGGRVDDLTGQWRECIYCDGIGFILSDAGERVAAFIDHAIQRGRARVFRS